MNGLIIGRFQPFHKGHLEALSFALSKVDKLWLGIGSSNKPNQKENPFSADERKEMILSSIDDSISKRIQIYYIPDLEDHKKWIENIILERKLENAVFRDDTLAVIKRRLLYLLDLEFSQNQLTLTSVFTKNIRFWVWG